MKNKIKNLYYWITAQTFMLFLYVVISFIYAIIMTMVFIPMVYKEITANKFALENIALPAGLESHQEAISLLFRRLYLVGFPLFPVSVIITLLFTPGLPFWITLFAYGQVYLACWFLACLVVLFTVKFPVSNTNGVYEVSLMINHEKTKKESTHDNT